MNIDEIGSMGNIYLNDSDCANIRKIYMKNILDVANTILSEKTESDTHPIYLLIKILANYETSKNLYSLTATHQVSSFGDVPLFSDMIPIQGYSQCLVGNGINKKVSLDDLQDDFPVKDKKETIDLNIDPVIVKPTKIEDFKDVLSGVTFKGGFIQDKKNHHIRLYMPYGVSIVMGGYHSISKGTLMCNAKLETCDIYNMTMVHDYLTTDGVHFYRRSDNSTYSSVIDFNLSAIYEIGSLIHEYAASAEIRFHGKLLSDFY